jgi:hypothetical protein
VTGLPGQYPICKERILSETLADGLSFFQGGTLYVTVDPRPWLINANIDFATGLESSWEGTDCRADQNWQATYENDQPCTSDTDCTNGFICNPEDSTCIVQFCIPDTNNPLASTGSAGSNFFSAIQGGGGAAYSVAYSR